MADLTTMVSKWLAQLYAGMTSVVYNGAEDATNYERFSVTWSSNEVFAGAEAGGTGTKRNLILHGANVYVGVGSTPTRIWGFTSSGNLLAQGNFAVGYGAGAGGGGTVTQLTSKSTGVQLDRVTGEITMNNAALNAATVVAFTLTNSKIEAGDYIHVQHVSGGTAGAYTCTAVAAAGSATINVRNATAGALSEAIVLKFMVFKAATT